MFLRALTVLTSSILALAVAFVTAHATPITLIDHLNNFRDTRGVNDVGVPPGDAIQFGADVTPGGLQGTTLGAVQGTRVLVPTVCNALAVNARNCSRSVAFTPTLNSAWDLTFHNGSDTATATTPIIGAAAATAAPFPSSVTISGSGFTPTLRWTVPAGFTPDAVRVNIYDKSGPSLPNGVKDVVHSQALAAGATSFIVPTTLNSGQPLRAGNSYVLNIQLIETAGHVPLVGGNFNDNIVRRSSAFFDFTPLTGGAPPQVFLPTVGPAPDPRLGQGAVYQFQVPQVRGGETIFIDPFVATGYKYTKGTGNPNFASVTLPAIGDNVFTLLYLQGQNLTLQQILANTQFFFPQGG